MKHQPIGKNLWAIPEGHIPSKSNGPKPEMESHDSFCVLNMNKDTAHLEVMVYFEDKDPVGPYKLSVPGQRTKHFRFNELSDPEEIPRDTDYASSISSDLPIIVQYTRLDSRQAENAIFTTLAYS